MAGLRRALVLESEATSSRDVRELGGKGAQLVRLQELGLRVPPFLVIPGSVFRTVLGPAEHLLTGLDEHTTDEELERRCAELQARILASAGPEGLFEALQDAVDRTLSSHASVAVRSSAADEDGRSHSFAGIHESELCVRGHAALRDSVRRVWASAVSPRALRYRLSQGLPVTGIRLAVVLQEMVDAAVSGVLFTADPATGDVHRCTISALYGLGEGLVSQGLDADLFQVCKDDLAIERQIATKEWQVLPDPARTGPVQRVPVPEAQRDQPCLTEGQIRELTGVGLRVERACGRPQDLEFCVDAEGRLFVLQTRAITTVAEYGPAAGNAILWDNSNIVESYAGVTTPMTFAFIRQAYASVYRSFAAFMGVPDQVIRERADLFDHMLGLIRGRVYYNLRNWYRLVALFPACRLNQGFMESMMGVSESLEDENTQAARPGRLRRLFVDGPRTAWLLARSLWAFGRIRRLVAGFEAHFERQDRRWAEVDVDALDPAGCRAHYQDMESRLLHRWRVPIINDFYVMIHYGLLRRLCERWLGPEHAGLHNELLCGTGGIRSTEPVALLDDLAERVQGNPELRRQVLEPDPAAPQAWRDPAGPDPEFVAGLEEYLAAFGDRCANELKLESRTLREDPEPLRKMLVQRLGRTQPTDHADQAADATGRAEERVRQLLRPQRWSRIREWLFFAVLRGARQGVRNRENLRLLRTRIFGRVRGVARRLGRHLVDEGLLRQEEDVFHLTLDELWDTVGGTTVTTDLQGLADLRRQTFDTYRQDPEPPADRFQTHGMVHHRNRYQPRVENSEPPADGVLRGVPCCPGEATASARIVRDPEDAPDLEDCILVAERTDPGWVPLFPFVKGLLVQRGSILSHSAIVARELGIPTVVGIPGLVRSVQDGQLLHMDGAQGTVEIVSPLSPCAAARPQTPSSDRSAPGTHPRRTLRTSPP